jgi:hypothetical protein
LVFFAAFKDHLGFYGVSKDVLEQFRDELAPFRTSTTTLHFSAENPLPAPLVEKIVRARVAENEEPRDTGKNRGTESRPVSTRPSRGQAGDRPVRSRAGCLHMTGGNPGLLSSRSRNRRTNANMMTFPR